MNETLYMFLFLLMFTMILVTAIFAVILIVGIVRGLKSKRTFPMKRLVLFLVSFSISLILFYNQYFNLDYLPAGELNASFASLDSRYEIETYHFNGIYGMNSKAVLVELETGDSKTIYFNWYDYDPMVEWVNKDTVKIGRETLNIHDGSYDYRHDPDVIRILPLQRKIH
ncbi:DUF5412 family protein [Aquibacillus saliphilus]|uniref:DUF5412 family protein n=1 Tax=Aquibacillus saliphilus TaxID=1909422 RepID=UPI001CEFC27C|nr:DUF5412 family protein [Aquibacillus saliphilus]